MVIATTPTDRNAMLLAARKWESEQKSYFPIMERGLLLELVGACELVGPQLSLALEGSRSVAVAQFCTSVVEQWSANKDTELPLASPTRLLSHKSCITNMVDFVAFALWVGIIIRLCMEIAPSRSRGSRRIRQRQVFQQDIVVPGTKLIHRVG